ncbi:hypothetical protein BDZ85DRAFT_260088 [Elsinoe ampelina]|uniref:Uncharacterized protein n=1 Tax=Elsinoe ampelina TaxID=302913 RepID=A0A6A6GDZ8_9PEZI|nr:hypothetical protein BDZ85DRAFT_260088 [Elsinoe ampelina]
MPNNAKALQGKELAFFRCRFQLWFSFVGGSASCELRFLGGDVREKRAVCVGWSVR